MVRTTLALAAGMLVASCHDPTAATRAATPSITSATSMPDARNAIAASVTVRVHDVDSAVVRYRLSGSAGAWLATPAVRVAGDSAVLPVLGLLPEALYDLRVVGYGAHGVAESEPLPLTTGALPADLPSYTASGDDPSPGYVVFAAGRYGIVIDNAGRVVWYRRFDGAVGLSFMAEPDGRYLLRPSTPQAGDVEPWIEVDPSGEVTRTLGCAHGLQTRPHDVIVDRDGSYLILCDETRTMDLSSVGGVAVARVTGTVVQRIGAEGALLFEWSPFDHFAITDAPLAERTGASVNWTHGNAIDRDADGNLLVSFRNLSEITKIDATTGAVIWRLGGVRSDFTFAGTATPAFVHQHGARSAGAGALLLLDNLGDPAESRAERYTIDEGQHVARLAQSYAAVPAAMTEIGGSVQPLAGGRTLVSFGTAGRVEEYDAAGRRVWHIEGNAGYVFRAQRIASLYAPGVGTSR